MSNKSSTIKTLIIIPARSGSKGVPDKNIRPLAERPLLCWTARAVELATIENALVILSTDSEDYKKIAQQCDLMVPFIRPDEYAQDQTSAFATAQHAIQWFEQLYHYQPEQIMWLQPTSPFRSPKIIQQALKLIDETMANCIIGCKAIDRDLTTIFKNENGYLQALSKDSTHQTRRQDISSLLTPNGAMYLIKTNSLLREKHFYPEKTLALPMDAVMSHDIDNETDWQIAQAYIKAKLGWMDETEYE